MSIGPALRYLARTDRSTPVYATQILAGSWRCALLVQAPEPLCQEPSEKEARNPQPTNCIENVRNSALSKVELSLTGSKIHDCSVGDSYYGAHEDQYREGHLIHARSSRCTWETLDDQSASWTGSRNALMEFTIGGPAWFAAPGAVGQPYAQMPPPYITGMPLRVGDPLMLLRLISARS